ncbi:MAG: hypothetical protein U9R19_15050 [Bacteroidota bacterium]|nr:hypothetical protein [Bacteroidota bacterium]
MNQLTLNIKDSSKLSILYELLNKLDFIEIENSTKILKKADDHDIFNSAGLWADREINAKKLRDEAWKRNQ